MKINIILTCLLVLSLVACKDTFLDLAPISSANSSTFYKTSSDMVLAINGAYGSLQLPGQYGRFFIVSEIPSDDTAPPLSGSITDQDEFDKFYLRTTNPILAERWSDGYRGIYRCNTILDRLIPIPMDETLKKRITGEAKFLRALMYFNLVRMFGGVPLVVKEIIDTNEGYSYGRNTVDEVYQQIIKDLSESELLLPAAYGAADVGRATSGAAKALLGKVYLTRKQYADAVAKLREVVDMESMGTYALLPNYGEVFKTANKNGKESVFSVQYKKGSLGEGSGFANLYAPQSSGNSVVLFSGDGNNRPTADLENAYEPGDVRKDISMASSYINEAGVKVDFYYVKKYGDQPVVKYDSEDNWPVIRYADVLLMYAEALNETGKTPDALPFLNRIRVRAKLGEKPALSQAEMRLALEHERRVELAFEGHRWFDLVRTGRAQEVINSKSEAISLPTNITANNLIFPIPQSQIDVNPSVIMQNPL
ncbi:RagB/SusD family nutrient uptake outer membrane protein [Dyadobacter alkalitolerans]|uniref:RagB/SusD family nutrient uptake outer membrane protein n=1 Tax=Dyadobacter alkalitolerans TaxID=492736 RepID=UPI00047D51F8|nr:RagB/SusD family nutrient uptake outer membrane protein [Dyadobacter alkalitolerans]